MESSPVDLDAKQIVRWIMAEQAAAPSTFKTSAACDRVAGDSRAQRASSRR
jgi:hypothetical protein